VLVIAKRTPQSNGTCYGTFSLHETLDEGLRKFLDTIVEQRKRRKLRVDGIITEILALRDDDWFRQPPPEPNATDSRPR